MAQADLNKAVAFIQTFAGVVSYNSMQRNEDHIEFELPAHPSHENIIHVLAANLNTSIFIPAGKSRTWILNVDEDRKIKVRKTMTGWTIALIDESNRCKVFERCANPANTSVYLPSKDKTVTCCGKCKYFVERFGTGKKH